MWRFGRQRWLVVDRRRLGRQRRLVVDWRHRRSSRLAAAAAAVAAAAPPAAAARVPRAAAAAAAAPPAAAARVPRAAAARRWQAGGRRRGQCDARSGLPGHSPPVPEPQVILNGTDLTGWKAMGAEKWAAQDMTTFQHRRFQRRPDNREGVRPLPAVLLLEDAVRRTRGEHAVPLPERHQPDARDPVPAARQRLVGLGPRTAGCPGTRGCCCPGAPPCRRGSPACAR